MMQFFIAHGFAVQGQDGKPLAAEDLHDHGAHLMDALLDLEKCNDDVVDSTTSSEADLGIIIVELLVTATNEADALGKFMSITRTAIHTVGGSTRFWSEPGTDPVGANADYRPEKVQLEYA